jgi:hypothetical protein
MEPQNEREYIIQLHEKLTSIMDDVRRIAASVEKIDNIRLSGVETRLSVVEAFVSKAKGAIWAIIILSGVIGWLIGLGWQQIFK